MVKNCLKCNIHCTKFTYLALLSFVAQNFCNNNINSKSKRLILIPKLLQVNYIHTYFKLSTLVSSKTSLIYNYRAMYDSFKLSSSLIDIHARLLKTATSKNYNFYCNLIPSTKKLILSNLLKPIKYSPRVLIDPHTLRLTKVVKLPIVNKTYNALVTLHLDYLLMNPNVTRNLFSNKKSYVWVSKLMLINPNLNLYYLKINNI